MREQRSIAHYHKVTGELVHEAIIDLSASQLRWLQDYYGLSEDNPMYDCFEVDDEVLSWLVSEFGVEVVESAGDHILFLECHEV